MSDTPVRRVSAEVLRQRFNEFIGQTESVLQLVVKDAHPSGPRARMPFCTRSQLVAYFLDGRKVALAHQYLLRDGSIGASGKPDPKMLEDGGVRYLLKHAGE